jgi:hypothetical protein
MRFAERYGPWAVVMGASEGTGREFARQIAAQGVPSILIARREGPLEALAREIREANGIECITAAIDLAAPEALGRIVEAVGDREIGLFVSNAGSDPNGSFFLDRELSAWTELVQRNVMTMMQCSHHFAGPMRARGRGGLLLVNSGAVPTRPLFARCSKRRAADPGGHRFRRRGRAHRPGAVALRTDSQLGTDRRRSRHGRQLGGGTARACAGDRQGDRPAFRQALSGGGEMDGDS